MKIVIKCQICFFMKMYGLVLSTDNDDGVREPVGLMTA